MPAKGDIIRIIPEIVLLVFAFGILFADVFGGRRARGSLGWAMFAGSLVGIASLLLVLNYRGSAFGGMIVLDGLSLSIKGILLISLALTALISISYVKREGLEHGEYYALILLSTIGMTLLASSANLIMIFLSLELLSVALYILSGFVRGQLRSEEAGLKYLLLGSFASAFLLYGAALIYGATGTMDLNGIKAAASELLSNPLLLAGIGFVLVGLAFKAAVVPFHMWTPDVYEGAPTPVTAFMSVGAKAAALAAIVRLFVFALDAMKPDWVVVFWVIAALTMITGNLIAIAQSNIKRMMAYSSVAHAGYLLIAIVAGSSDAITSIPFYLLVYAFLNIGAFTVAFVVAGKGDKHLDITDFSGLFYRSPWLAVSMAVFMFGLAGLPPTSGFMAKFYLFAAAVKAGFTGLVVIGVLTTLISVYFYVRVTVMMFMQRPSEQEEAISVSGSVATALAISTVITIILGILPGPVFELVRTIIR